MAHGSGFDESHKHSEFSAVELRVLAIRDFPEGLLRQFDKVVWIVNIDQQLIWLLLNMSFRRKAHRVQRGIHLRPPQMFRRSAQNLPC